jgi:hypothetical protein
MKKIVFFLLTIILICVGCDSDAILTKKEYTITDTTYVAKNGFNGVLSYSVIFLNHYDSLYYSGEILPSGKLIRMNPRPISVLKKKR